MEIFERSRNKACWSGDAWESAACAAPTPWGWPRFSDVLAISD